MRKIIVLLMVLFIFACGENSSSPKEQLAKPENLTADLQEGLLIKLSWDDVSGDESGFIIQRHLESENYLNFAEVDANVQEYFDTNLETNKTYYYRIAAIKDDDQSDWSNSAIAHTPSDVAAPSNLHVVDLANDHIILNWNDNTNDETGFTLERKTGNNGFQEIVQLNSNVTEFNDSSVDPITTYHYRIAAIRSSGNTGWSDEISVTTPPSVNGLEFGEDESFEILTWNIEHFPLNNDITVGYVVETINQVDPDIIALQEIESGSHFYQILDQLEGWTGYKANSAYYNIDLAYLFKTEMIQVNSVYEIFGGDYYFPRSPLVAEIEVNGANLVIINNHLKAMDGVENEERRRQACILLEEYISNNHDDDNVIVLGDMNDLLTDTGNNNVFNSFILKPEKYTFTDMDIAEGNQAYWSYPGWPSHLDHILISNELFDEFESDGSSIQTIRVDLYLSGGLNEYEDNVSDHRPVGLKFEL